MPNNQSRKRDHQAEGVSQTQCQDDNNITEAKKRRKYDKKHKTELAEIVKHSPESIKAARKYGDFVFNIDKEDDLKLKICNARDKAQNNSSRISCLLNKKRELICAFSFINRRYKTAKNDVHNCALTKRLRLYTSISLTKISDPKYLDPTILKEIKEALFSFIQENNCLQEKTFFYIAEKYKEEIKEWSNKSNNSTKSATSPINTVACKEGDIVDTQTNNESEYGEKNEDCSSSLLEQCEEFDVSEMFTHPYKNILDELPQRNSTNNNVLNEYLQNIEKLQNVNSTINSSKIQNNESLKKCKKPYAFKMLTYSDKKIIDELIQEDDTNNDFPNTCLQNIEKPQCVDFETSVGIGISYLAKL